MDFKTLVNENDEFVHIIEWDGYELCTSDIPLILGEKTTMGFLKDKFDVDWTGIRLVNVKLEIDELRRDIQ